MSMSGRTAEFERLKEYLTAERGEIPYPADRGCPEGRGERRARWDRARAQKRGGGSVAVPFDTAFAASRYAAEPAATQPADREYERRWAMILLEQAMARLRADYEHVRADRGV